MPLGCLIDEPEGAGHFINGGSSQHIDDLTKLALNADGGKPCLAIFKAAARNISGP